MTDDSRQESVETPARSDNGAAPPPAGATRRYCGQCGHTVSSDGETAARFGEAFCSEAHAEAFVVAVRSARARAAAQVEPPPAPAETSPMPDAGAAVAAPPAVGELPTGAAASTTSPSGWASSLKMAVCWGAPLLALVILAGGGGALLGAAAWLLPVLLLLACPIAMYFMMRGMSRGHCAPPEDRDRR
jgi:hypothetical protein